MKSGKTMARKKSLKRTTSWNRIGRVSVTRNRRGRFVTWHKIRRYRRGVTAKTAWRTGATRRGLIRFGGGKGVAVWKGNKRVQIVGSGQKLYQAMRLVSKHPPKKQFLTISAEALLESPEDYLEKGRWNARPNIESR
jgi:hypothetical protein